MAEVCRRYTWLLPRDDESTFELRLLPARHRRFPAAAPKRNAEIILWEKGDWELKDPKVPSRI